VIQIRRYVAGDYDPRTGPLHFAVQTPQEILQQPFIRSVVEEDGFVLKFTDDGQGRIIIQGECPMSKQRKIVAVVEGTNVDEMKKIMPYLQHTLATIAERNRIAPVEIRYEPPSIDFLERFMDSFVAAVRYNDYKGVAHLIKNEILKNSPVFIGYTVYEAMKFAMSLNTRGNGIELVVLCGVHACRNGLKVEEFMFSQEVKITFGTMPHAEKEPTAAPRTAVQETSLIDTPIVSSGLHSNLAL
jgi:hypothetical protein